MSSSAALKVKELAPRIAPVLFAIYLACNLHTHSLTDIWIFIGWVALCAGVIMGGISRGNRWTFYSLITLLAFHALAVPGSLIWGNGNWELTAGVVLWMAPALLLYLAKDAERTFTWLIPAFLTHSALIFWQGLNNHSVVGDVVVRHSVPTGLANNPNIAAGFLILGIIYLLQSPRKWLSLPLLAALLFTGSRWGLMVAVVLLVAMVLTRAISWRPLAGALAALVLAVLVFSWLPGNGLEVAGHGSLTSALNTAQVDVGVRLAVPHLPSFLPTGVAEHPGLHNVPLRIAVENGLLAAGLWVLITGWALLKSNNPKNGSVNCANNNCHSEQSQHKHIQVFPCLLHNVHRLLLFPFRGLFGAMINNIGKRSQTKYCREDHNSVPRPTILNANSYRGQANQTDHCKPGSEFPLPSHAHININVHRWLLLSLVLLSVLDYYTWMGHLGGFWWLLIGLLLKR